MKTFCYVSIFYEYWVQRVKYFQKYSVFSKIKKVGLNSKTEQTGPIITLHKPVLETYIVLKIYCLGM